MPASGKGTFKDLLEEELDYRGISHQYRSLSDELRAEVRLRGLPADRQVLHRIGNELRQEYGASVLSRRVLDKIAADGHECRWFDVTVIDAIRNPAEATLLRDVLSPNFVLVAVEAPVEVIVERIQARGRKGDIVHTDDLARGVLAREMGLNEPEYGHNIARCIEMADVSIDNAGPLSSLRQSVRQFVDKYVLPSTAAPSKAERDHSPGGRPNSFGP